MPWLLLPYTTTTQALSATTAEVINGSKPYLTFDNGVTKVATTEGLLSITISDGTTQTTYTPRTNTSTEDNPIVLPVANQSFADIGMLIPTNTNSIALSDLISAPYNYWGDDDGDGQGTNGITATGNLSIRITDKNDKEVSRSTTLDICQAPYKVKLTSTDGSLTTQYGLPNSSNFSASATTYYINPKDAPKICYLFTINVDESNPPYAGPADIWTSGKGFLVQSTESSSYDRNFPTTGADHLFFDLDIGGIRGSTLTWSTISQGGITATAKKSPYRYNIRISFSGPKATSSQQESDSPGSIATPTLPQTFVIVGKDSSNREVLKYGFVLKHWFVNRGKKTYKFDKTSWCSNFGYRVPQLKDLTNAKCGKHSFFPCVNGVDGATPLSDNNYSQRNIGNGFLTEWGSMWVYAADLNPLEGYWAGDDLNDPNMHTTVSTTRGSAHSQVQGWHTHSVLCIYP